MLLQVEVVVTNKDPNDPDTFIPKAKWRGHIKEFEREAEETGRILRRELRLLTERVIAPFVDLKLRLLDVSMTLRVWSSIAKNDDCRMYMKALSQRPTRGQPPH